MSHTPILQLNNIGKIYVSEGNVAVGIRGVNLSFERGEFVAVTGKSGSGKSTLLNVISGMDTYEEGELYIEGEPTSHYQQKDWEAYREAYISFIFQDYNILESFTVLENVELALMHIDDPVARREKAMELIRRVGLEGHIRHKGSKLSGGQKQRTVIARALAKDSPIILADEPTGNLDSKTSAEIIELLREVSRDKLLIMVTHNFDQVEACATRHIRIFDGAVELDQTIRPTTPPPKKADPVEFSPPPSAFRKKLSTLKKGLHLGRVRAKAMPKLTVFLCLLMTLTTLVVTFMTARNYEATGLFEKPTMFTHMKGRTVIVRSDGKVITDDELKKLAAEIGAKDYLHYDYMLDNTLALTLDRVARNGYTEMVTYRCSYGYPASDVALDEGRYPAADDEVILEVPISAKPYLGEDGFEETKCPLTRFATYRIVGVRYYYDNTVTPRLLFTENGYRLATALRNYEQSCNGLSYYMSVELPEGNWMTSFDADFFVDFTLPTGTYYLSTPDFAKELEDKTGKSWRELSPTTLIVGEFRTSDYNDDFYGDIYYEEIVEDVIKPGDSPSDVDPKNALYSFSSDRLASSISESTKDMLKNIYGDWEKSNIMLISPDLLMEFMNDEYYGKVYTQASLFFDSDREAHSKVETLRERGYIAVVSDETVEPDFFTMLLEKIGYAFLAFGWILTIVFVTFFLNLCSARAMNATRGDIGIMRSMGIPTPVVRISIYVQTLLALIPAVLVTAAACVAVYLIPKTNSMFTFLHAVDYILLAVVLVAIAFNLSRKQVAKMFNESVKKTLRKGGGKA